MKRITENQSRHSLTTQIVLWVVGFLSVLFVTALFIMFHHARKSIYQEAMEKARQTLRTTELRIDNTLKEVETATRSMHWTIEKRLNRPEIMDSLCRQLLRENPHIQGCAIAFEPGVYPKYGTYYEVFGYRSQADSTQIQVTVNAGKQPYTREKWYFIPLHHEEPIWIDSYVDTESGETSIVTAYGMPLHDKDGELVGVLSAHISMKWFADLVLSLKPFPNSHALVMGTDGHLIIHPDSTLEEHEAFFADAFNDPTNDGHLAAISMKTGHIGHSQMRIDGTQNFIFYHPFENAGWSVAIVCPESDIFSSYNSLLRYTIIISLSGLLLLALFCLFISHHQLKPLQQLVDAAHQMATGQMDEPVKVSHRTDEVGYVQNTFRQMQESITQHITHITQLTDVLRQRNEDLKLAYEQARESDRMKDAVILNMSDRMEQSVKAIHATVAEFRQHAVDMDAEECRHMADKDSLLKYSHRIVANHPNTNGCSITMEPDFFPGDSYGFSAYSVRLDEQSATGKDSVVTVREEDYDYYSKVWYKTPRQKRVACWVDPFDDYNAGTLSSPEMIASYCIPLHDDNEKFVGVISTDLIGQLQNNFCQMRRSISQHIHDTENTKQETEQRTSELEQATQLARQASEQKTQFMQDMSHQIRTPLNIVQGFSQVLRDGGEMMGDDEKREVAETMYVQTNALDYMVSKLLTVSLIESRQTISTDDTVGCNDVAREAFENASSLTTHTAEMRLDSHVGDEVTVQTNRHHLLIALTELLVNALHFTNEGVMTMRFEATDTMVNFTIEDTGPGIPSDKADFVFEKFTKIDMFTEGLGLGLFLCRRVIMLMGGTLTLDPGYTNGCRFVESIPLKQI